MTGGRVVCAMPVAVARRREEVVYCISLVGRRVDGRSAATSHAKRESVSLLCRCNGGLRVLLVADSQGRSARTGN